MGALFICFMIISISASNTGPAANTREIPLLFSRSAVASLVLCIGLVKVDRLGQRLNIPTQGQTVTALTGDERPFSRTVLGSDPQLGIGTRPHWWETDTLPTDHLSSHSVIVYMHDQMAMIWYVRANTAIVVPLCGWTHCFPSRFIISVNSCCTCWVCYIFKEFAKKVCMSNQLDYTQLFFSCFFLMC